MEGRTLLNGQTCPLALLAQTCSKIAANALPPDAFSAKSQTPSTNFQFQSSNRGSLVKIAPASSRPTGSEAILLKSSKNPKPFIAIHPQLLKAAAIQNQLSTAKVSNPVAGLQNVVLINAPIQKSSIPVAAQALPVRKTPVTILGPFSSVGCASSITQKIKLENTLDTDGHSLSLNASIVEHDASRIADKSDCNGMVTSRGDLQALLSNNTDFKSDFPPQVISIMQPETLTAKMLQVMPPQSQSCEIQQNKDPPPPCDGNSQVEICEAREGDKTTVQITVPQNTTPEGLQKILLIAAKAAQKYQYQNASKNGTASIHKGDSSLNKIFKANATISPTSPQKQTLANNSADPKKSAVKKTREACNCLNCRKPIGTRGKRHICWYPNCAKEFNKTSHLRSHFRTHTGERPYVCDVAFCDRKFTRSDELLRHRRTHGGIKKFKCHFCSKLFMRSDHMKKHLKTHTRLQVKDKTQQITNH